MTQTQMTAYLADKIGISKRQAKSALDELNELVTRQLKKEGLLRLAGLGVFRKRKLKARMGRNPATGEQIKIPARTRLRFTPAKALKDSVRRAPRNFAACTVRSFPRPRVERSAIFCEPRARRNTRWRFSKPAPQVRTMGRAAAMNATSFTTRRCRLCWKPDRHLSR